MVAHEQGALPCSSVAGVAQDGHSLSLRWGQGAMPRVHGMHFMVAGS